MAHVIVRFLRDDLNIPVETVHRWMITHDVWIPRSKRLKHPYQPRYNRDWFGELIQIDGSYHVV